MGTVHATQAQLNAMASRCEETGSSIATGMAQLIDRVQTLSGAGLAGQANVALQDVSGQLNEGLKKILDALGELAGKMTSAGTQYSVQDDDAAREIRDAASATGNNNVVTILRG